MTDKKTEALKLALKKAFDLGQRYWQQADSDFTSQWRKADVTLASFNQLVEDTIREALAEQPAPATELREQEPVSDRENAIIRFALHQFMSNAYSHMNAAAQDKDSRHYTVGAVEKFAKDAKDAEALLSRLQFKAPQPAQRKPWVGLTELEALGAYEAEQQGRWGDHVRGLLAVEAKLREKNNG